MMYRYEYPDQFENMEREDFSRYSGNIVLWGAGKIGGITAYLLKQKGIEVLAFVDMLPEKQGAEFCGIKIISPEAFFTEYPDAELIITTIGRSSVLAVLKEKGFTRWHDAWSLLIEFDFGDYSEQNQMYMARMVSYFLQTEAHELDLKAPYITNRLRIYTTSRCSLRCEECCAFVPYVQDPHDYDPDKMISDISVFLEAVGGVFEVEFMGGEPLLTPGIAKVVKALKNNPDIQQISVLTNGTILPDNELLDALEADSRSIYRMSCYGKLSVKIAETEPLLKERHIRYEIIDYKTWYKKSELKVLNETDEQIRKKFNSCMESCGLVMWDGKIFFCMLLPFLAEMGVFPRADDNFYDIRAEGKSYQDNLKGIAQYADRANRGEYADACRYCTGKTSVNFGTPVSPAKQTKGRSVLPPIVI